MELRGLDSDDNLQLRCYIDSYNGLGEIAYFLKDYDNAMMYFDHVGSLEQKLYNHTNNPSMAKTFKRIADVYMVKEKYEEALSYYGRAHNARLGQPKTDIDNEVLKNIEKCELKLGYSS